MIDELPTSEEVDIRAQVLGLKQEVAQLKETLERERRQWVQGKE